MHQIDSLPQPSIHWGCLEFLNVCVDETISEPTYPAEEFPVPGGRMAVQHDRIVPLPHHHLPRVAWRKSQSLIKLACRVWTWHLGQSRWSHGTLRGVERGGRWVLDAR